MFEWLKKLFRTESKPYWGLPGFRDPDSICRLFEPRERKPGDETCHGDGHALCGDCAKYVPKDSDEWPIKSSDERATETAAAGLPAAQPPVESAFRPWKTAQQVRDMEQRSVDVIPFTARQGGQKRNRVHYYSQPFGYPIRVCDWVAVDRDGLEKIEYFNNPNPITGVVVICLRSREGTGEAVCKHCLAIAEGRQSLPLAVKNHGRGKGAPLP